MNEKEKEKEAVEIVANNLIGLAVGLETGEFISPRDIAWVLRKRVKQLYGILDGNVELSDGTGETDAPPPRPDKAKQEKTKQLAAFRRSDANYIAERIGELHSHAILHDGELCAKLNRSRIGGMVEVLSRMGLEVVCDWNRCDKAVVILPADDFIQFKKVKEGK